MFEFLYKNDSKKLVQEKTCFKNSGNPSCIDLFITNSTRSSYRNGTTLATGLSDFHKIILTVILSTFPKVKPKESIYRNFKNFNLNNFKNDIWTNMQLVDNYDEPEKEFLKVLNNHAPLKKKFIRANHVPYMTKALRKAIKKRSQLESKHY